MTTEQLVFGAGRCKRCGRALTLMRLAGAEPVPVYICCGGPGFAADAACRLAAPMGGWLRRAMADELAHVNTWRPRQGDLPRWRPGCSGGGQCQHDVLYLGGFSYVTGPGRARHSTKALALCERHGRLFAVKHQLELPAGDADPAPEGAGGSLLNTITRRRRRPRVRSVNFRSFFWVLVREAALNVIAPEDLSADWIAYHRRRLSRMRTDRVREAVWTALFWHPSRRFR